MSEPFEYNSITTANFRIIKLEQELALNTGIADGLSVALMRQERENERLEAELAELREENEKLKAELAEPRERTIAETLGWVTAFYCTALDRGEDPRVEVKDEH